MEKGKIIVGGILLSIGILLLISCFYTCLDFIDTSYLEPERVIVNIIWLAFMLTIGIYLTSKGISFFKEK